jgi:hypothetical protein
MKEIEKMKTIKVKAATRKTKDGYFQPVLIVTETGQRFTPGDWSCPCIDRATAKKQAEWFCHEATQTGSIPAME